MRFFNLNDSHMEETLDKIKENLKEIKYYAALVNVTNYFQHGSNMQIATLTDRLISINSRIGTETYGVAAMAEVLYTDFEDNIDVVLMHSNNELISILTDR